MATITLERRSTAEGPRLTWGLVGAVAVVVALLLGSKGVTPESLGLALRSTARVSSALLLLAFVASSLARIWPSAASRWLLRQRRYVGLAFGGVHGIHGVLVLMLATTSHGGDITAMSPAPEVAGGVFVYLVIVVMMLTSSDRAVAALGTKRWRRLHRFGIWLLFLVFLLDYGHLAILYSPAYWAPTAVFLAALGVRLLARRGAAGH